jgi:hypothetical protein
VTAAQVFGGVDAAVEKEIFNLLFHPVERFTG